MRKTVNGIFILALMTTAGCSSKSAVTSTESTGGSTSAESSAPSSPALPSTPTGYGFDKYQTGPLGDVFFDFDSSTLGTEAQGQLKQNSEWLGSNTAKGALIEGHCDARGTAEYNLALGERRAATAKEYLVKLGVAASRLESVSYGEERPFDAAQNDEAWAKNRRAHFVIK
ncbi:peptidoglycan-associated lipoprotein Pal [Chlorobium sp. BLA1]|uniref:peptidoglycan-associated lipoprotein Pal n=1 Tax=Candidatus Chlorobium masyuteum TaxID=2716876 RepID=UPI00141F9E61|nr:peptidoglycan-associated lipoprotein Pal [Candidatus Chlorobium masyuteum]NHQ60614.1 peptidoglycan-associated lipoprotein Pal [Candidatus Chlorobium masyuteum]